mmetsp:Transcript_50122/g.129007  ORF Transcript_50122/g.129007 Transcript_50122/m.129007 type:complete len:179 (+) Transcript_50122:67-603(+)
MNIKHSRTPIPLSERKSDYFFIFWFLLNIFFITYIVDYEQLAIADVSNFEYPVWPPKAMVDLVHWYGHNFDPVLIARPMWWKMTIWWDVLFFGPFYMLALFAFIKGKEWIRLPGTMYAASITTIVGIILGEEAFGSHPTPSPLLVFCLNVPWFAVPLLLALRLGWSNHPFTRHVEKHE